MLNEINVFNSSFAYYNVHSSDLEAHPEFHLR